VEIEPPPDAHPFNGDREAGEPCTLAVLQGSLAGTAAFVAWGGGGVLIVCHRSRCFLGWSWPRECCCTRRGLLLGSLFGLGKFCVKAADCGSQPIRRIQARTSS